MIVRKQTRNIFREMWYGPTGSPRNMWKKTRFGYYQFWRDTVWLRQGSHSTAAIMTFPLAVTTESVGDLYSLTALSQKRWCNCRNTSLSGRCQKSVMQSEIAVHVTVSVVGVLPDICKTTEPRCVLMSSVMAANLQCVKNKPLKMACLSKIYYNTGTSFQHSIK